MGKLQLQFLAISTPGYTFQLRTLIQNLIISVIAMKGDAGKALTYEPFIGWMDIAEIIHQVEYRDILGILHQLAGLLLLLTELRKSLGSKRATSLVKTVGIDVRSQENIIERKTLVLELQLPPVGHHLELLGISSILYATIVLSLIPEKTTDGVWDDRKHQTLVPAAYSPTANLSCLLQFLAEDRTLLISLLRCPCLDAGSTQSHSDDAHRNLQAILDIPDEIITHGRNIRQTLATRLCPSLLMGTERSIDTNHRILRLLHLFDAPILTLGWCHKRLVALHGILHVRLSGSNPDFSYYHIIIYKTLLLALDNEILGLGIRLHRLQGNEPFAHGIRLSLYLQLAEAHGYPLSSIRRTPNMHRLLTLKNHVRRNNRSCRQLGKAGDITH